MTKHRMNVSLDSEDQAERFKALGGSKWLRGLIEASKTARIIPLTDEERMLIVEAVSGAPLPTSDKEQIIRKMTKE